MSNLTLIVMVKSSLDRWCLGWLVWAHGIAAETIEIKLHKNIQFRKVSTICQDGKEMKKLKT